MNEPAKNYQPIDLEEFERRLKRSSVPQSEHADPLAELARIVDGEKTNPFAALFSRTPPSPPAPRQEKSHEQNREEEQIQDEYPQDIDPFFKQDQDYVDPVGQWRADIDEEKAHFTPSEERDALGERERTAFPDFPLKDQDPPSASRRSLYMSLGCAALLSLGMGGLYLFKASSPLKTTPPTILASSDPYKVPAPETPPPDSMPTSVSILERGQETSPANSRIVNRAEEPVDLSRVPAAAPARVVLPGPQPPVPPATAVSSSNANPDAASTSPFPEPKRVRAIPIRVDTSPANETASIPSQKESPSPLAPDAPPSVKKPSSVATSPPSPKTSTQAPTSPKGVASKQPVTLVAPPETEKTDTAQGSSLAKTSNVHQGDWFVQLSATSSDTEARQQMDKYVKKYQALKNYKLTSQKAENQGRDIFRLRILSLSQSDALSLCTAIKSEGGSCFAARN